MFIEEAHMDDGTAPVFKLADLAQLYTSRMEQLGVERDGRMHTTRLKETAYPLLCHVCVLKWILMLIGRRG